MASQVLQVQGTSIRISLTEVVAIGDSPSPAFATLDCIGREIQYQGGQSTEIDVTTICSSAKEFRLGLDDPGTMSLSGHWKQGNAGHNAIRTASTDKKTRLIEVTFEDGSIFRALAIVSQRSFAAAVDGVVTAQYNFRLTGATEEVDPT